VAPVTLLALLRENAIPCTEVTSYGDYLEVFLAHETSMETAIKAERILSEHPEASWVKRVDNCFLRFHLKPPLPPNAAITARRAALIDVLGRSFAVLQVPRQRTPVRDDERGGR